ncbi:MAG: hypothetical protein AAF447_26465 [Myxococcota bacterium]
MTTLALAPLLGLLALVLRAVFPERFLNLTRTLVEEPGACLLAGTGGALALGGVSLAAAITVLGLPLAALLAGAGTLGAYVGLAAVATVVGAALPWPTSEPQPQLRVICGAAALLVARWVPVVGGLLLLCAALFGFGGLLRTRFAAEEDEWGPGAPQAL